MSTSPIAPETAADAGATVVITHRVRDGKHESYNTWLNEIGPLVRGWKGHLDWQIIRPLTGLTGTYTVVIRFDTRENLESWMHSPERLRLIDKVQPLLAAKDDFYIRSGLDFWFTPEGAKARVPVRWKQFLVTWSAIFPLVLGASLTLPPLMRALGLPDNHYAYTLLATGAVVFLMVYVVMPRYTRLLQRWLFE